MPTRPRPSALRALAFVTALTGAALTGAGCESLVDVDPDGYAPLLVVEGRFTAGEPWAVTLTRTVALSDTTSPYAPVTDASVTVTSGAGATVVLVHQGGGRYAAADSAGPASGVAYTLYAVAPGLPPATATDAAPPPVTGLALDVASAGGPDGPTALTLRFDDPPDRADFYEFVVLSDLGAPGGPFLRPFRSDHPSLRQESFLTSLGGGAGPGTYGSGLVSDRLFRGVPFAADLQVDAPVTAGYAVELRVMSEAHYRFLQRRAQIDDASGNPFAEPVPPFSNVLGGVGLFAGATRQRTAGPAAR